MALTYLRTKFIFVISKKNGNSRLFMTILFEDRLQTIATIDALYHILTT